MSIGGELAEAIRTAAAAAGASPAHWVGSVVAERLAGENRSSATPAPEQDAGEGRPRGGATAPTDWEQVTDDTASFSVSLPKGWQNRAWVVPTPTMRYPMVTTTSPDGRTTLFTGDAEIPMFIDPASGMFPAQGMALRPPTPAGDFLAEWLDYRARGRQGFRLLGIGEDPQLVELATRGAARNGTPVTWLTGARAVAEYDEAGARVRAVYLAATIGLGPGWLAQVHGVSSADDPETFLPALLRMVDSVVSTPAEQQRILAERQANDARHRATMQQIDQNTAMMTAGHQQRMANIQASGIAHQQNMASRQAAFDAGVDAWQQQQASSDAQHAGYLGGLRSGAATPGTGGNPQQDFVNMINEERTVLDADGQAHQVAAGADRYYHNQHTDTWVGLQEHQDIVEVTGANREDYQEGTIQS